MMRWNDAVGHALDRDQHYRDIRDERTAGIAIIQMCCGLVNRRAFQERLVRVVHPGVVKDVAHGALDRHRTTMSLKIYGPHGSTMGSTVGDKIMGPHSAFSCHSSFDAIPYTVRLDEVGRRKFLVWLRAYCIYESAVDYSQVLWALEKDVVLPGGGIPKWAPRHDRENPLE